jgi:predicted metal-dependent peptidase
MKQDPIEIEMLKARVRLLFEQPLLGQMIMHLDMRDASDWCDTAATDGKNFYYNREFIKSLDLEELIFVHGHEIYHCALDHIFRRGDRDKDYWNQSIDFIVNYILVRDKVGKMPKGCLYNEYYTDEFSAEELYALLERTGVKRQPMDVHLDASNPGRTGAPTLSPAEIDEIRDTMRSVMMQAIEATDPSKFPAGLTRILNRLRKPKINWRQMLVSVLRSTIKYDYTYTRLSRRSWSSGLILPGQDVTERVEAIAFLDGSGSTTQEMVTDFLSESRGIMKMFRDFSLTIGTFDVNVYNVRVFTPSNANEIESYEFIGGGGTAPSCCWDYMKVNHLKPDKLIIFTDGEVGNDWGDSQYCDTLFIIHSNPGITAPYGKTVHYEKSIRS